MPDPSLSEAIREAYAVAPSDVIIHHTLELRHPAFVDDDGNATAIRVVRDHQNLTARLEASAPMDSGEMVAFIAMGFELELPPVDTVPVPEITVTLDNVSRELVKHLDAAVTSQEKIEITYRPYLSNDLEGPQMDPPLTLILTEVEASIFRITGRARMLNIGKKAFPSEVYTAKRFPGLSR
ncbi:MAG: DUF1833 family protein [Magnetococcales bacterium]|nr:DUF1833 family protein [Magnetococcales bacterium]